MARLGLIWITVFSVLPLNNGYKTGKCLFLSKFDHLLFVCLFIIAMTEDKGGESYMTPPALIRWLSISARLGLMVAICQFGYVKLNKILVIWIHIQLIRILWIKWTDANPCCLLFSNSLLYAYCQKSKLLYLKSKKKP